MAFSTFSTFNGMHFQNISKKQVINPTAPTNNLTTSAALYSRFLPSNYNTSNNTWTDTTGTNNIPSTRITSTGISLVTTTTNTNNAVNSFTALQGGTSSIVQFTTANITNYTLFYISRFLYPHKSAGGYRGCVLTGSGESLWHTGMFYSSTGAANHAQGGLMVSYQGYDRYGTDWFISTDSSSLYKANGRTYSNTTSTTAVVADNGSLCTGTLGGTTYLPSLCANSAANIASNVSSNFQLGDILIYNSYLWY
jgi:hypothetical protein